MTNIISADMLPVSLFALNVLLVLLDASLGYHLAPRLLRLSEPGEPELQQAAIRTVRSLLAFMVALYMFFNCVGYYRDSTLLMLVVTGLIAADLGAQLYLGRRPERRGDFEE